MTKSSEILYIALSQIDLSLKSIDLKSHKHGKLLIKVMKIHVESDIVTMIVYNYYNNSLHSNIYIFNIILYYSYIIKYSLFNIIIIVFIIGYYIK